MLWSWKSRLPHPPTSSPHIQTIISRIESLHLLECPSRLQLKRNRMPLSPHCNTHRNLRDTLAIKSSIFFAGLDPASQLAFERTVSVSINAYRAFTRKSSRTTDTAQQGADETILFVFAYCAQNSRTDFELGKQIKQREKFTMRWNR